MSEEINHLSNAELVFDRQESFNDIVSCLVFLSTDDNFPNSDKITNDQKIEGCKKRLIGNLGIINTIMEECKKRGFDPAMYQQEEK